MVSSSTALNTFVKNEGFTLAGTKADADAKRAEAEIAATENFIVDYGLIVWYEDCQ